MLRSKIIMKCMPEDAARAPCPDPYLTTKEAARHLGYSHRTLENLRYREQGPPWVSLPSGSVRYRQSELDAWAASTAEMPAASLTWEALRERERKAKRAARDKQRQLDIRAARKAARLEAIRLIPRAEDLS